MGVGYPDLKAALLRRGWIETLDKESEKVDLKFTFSHSDINYQRLKSGALVNHCRAEGSLTCKTSLIETLSESQAYWASWLAKSGVAEIKLKGYSEGGIDSFFPKSFIISNINEQGLFFEEMVFNTCESYIKLFLAAFAKEE